MLPMDMSICHVIVMCAATNTAAAGDVNAAHRHVNLPCDSDVQVQETQQLLVMYLYKHAAGLDQMQITAAGCDIKQKMTCTKSVICILSSANDSPRICLFGFASHPAALHCMWYTATMSSFYVPCTDLWVYSTGTAPPGCETTCTCTLRLSGSMRRMTASRVWHRTQGPSHSPAFTLHTCTKLFRQLAYVKSVMCGFVPV